MRCVAVLTAPDTIRDTDMETPGGLRVGGNLFAVKPGAVIWWGRCHTVGEARGYVGGCKGAHLTIWRDIWTDSSLDWPTFVVLREGRPIALAEVVR